MITFLIILDTILGQDFMTKNEARKIILQNYPEILKGQEYIELLKSNQSFLNSKIIGLYYPLKSEVDLMDLMTLFKDKIYVFPRIKENTLKYYLVNSIKDLVPGIYHTMEPNNHCPCIPNDAIELLFVPCVGVSHTLQRLGRGMGYYDNFMLSLKHSHIHTIACLPKSRINLDIKMRKEDMTIDEIITYEN